MERAGHEGVVLHGVGKDDDLGAAEAVGIGGQLGGALDDVAHLAHGVHVDAAARGADVDAAAEARGFGEGLRHGVQQRFLGAGRALVHERAVSADEVDPDRLGGPVQRHGDGHGVVPADHAHGGDADALVDDRHAQLAFQLAAHAHQIARHAGHFVIDGLRGFAVGVFLAVQQADAHRDGADVEMLLAHHADGL